MKKKMSAIVTVLLILMNFLYTFVIQDGLPLPNRPDAENIDSVTVEHDNYPDNVIVHTDSLKIKVAAAITGFLNYNPLKKASTEAELIKMTFKMKDGSEYIIYADNSTVTHNGNSRALRNEGEFVKWCTAFYFLQDK